MASTTTDSDGGGGGLGWLDGTSSSKSLLVQGFILERRAPAGSGDWIAEFSAWVKAVVKHVAAVRFFKQTPPGQCSSTDLNHLSAASFQVNSRILSIFVDFRIHFYPWRGIRGMAFSK